MCYVTSNFSKSREWSMGGRYDITNRGKDEEIVHSTHLSRSMGEGIMDNETYIYQLNSEAGMGKMFNFLELFPP